MYVAHRRALLAVLGAENIDGLSLYSWKDTGITEHARITTPLATRDQARHSDFDMTLTYYRQDKVNEEYRNLNSDIMK